MAELVFRTHALRRMFQRRITADEVRAIVTHGEAIENRPDDLPYPSRLLLGEAGGRKLHVVVADAPEATVVVTVYEPDPALWMPGFKRRKP